MKQIRILTVVLTVGVLASGCINPQAVKLRAATAFSPGTQQAAANLPGADGLDSQLGQVGGEDLAAQIAALKQQAMNSTAASGPTPAPSYEAPPRTYGSEATARYQASVEVPATPSASVAAAMDEVPRPVIPNYSPTNYTPQ